MDKYKEALEDMVWQFAYRGNNEDRFMLYSGGLSALEHAFEVLGWHDPHYIGDKTLECDIYACHRWRSPQITWDGVYVCICDVHFQEYLAKKPLPPLKNQAKEREARRNKETGVLDR